MSATCCRDECQKGVVEVLRSQFVWRWCKFRLFYEICNARLPSTTLHKYHVKCGARRVQYALMPDGDAVAVVHAEGLCLSKIRKDLNGQELYFLLALYSLSFDAYFSTSHHLAFAHLFTN